MQYIAPKVYERSFTCPHCGAISQQEWWHRTWDGIEHQLTDKNQIRVSRCVHCSSRTLWIGARMYFPDTGSAPVANPELPEEVKKLYLEAAAICARSPRGAAALLRLGIQVLCRDLGEKGKNIDDDIASLVSKGLPVIVQQSLDIVRVTGNHAVHPGQIDTDDPEVVAQLFALTNIISEYMIAMPKKVSGLYSSLPAKALDAIRKRDQA
jgi:hypothetical protein